MTGTLMQNLNDAMTLPEIIDQLADIETPAPVSFMPETQGWLVLGVGILAALIVFVVWLRKRRQRNQYRRAALLELGNITTANGPSPAATLSAAAELTKRTALMVYPRDEVAALHGSAWATFMQTHSDLTPGPGLQALVHGPYRAEPDNVTQALESARTWILTHRV